MNHKFVKVNWEAAELKRKNGIAALNVTHMTMNAVPMLREAVKSLLDAVGIEYLSTTE